MEQLNQLITANWDRFIFYSPYNFLRQLDPNRHREFLKGTLAPWLSQAENHFTFFTETEGNAFHFMYQYLPWDSNYFQTPTYKVYTVFHNSTDFQITCRAVAAFKAHLQEKGTGYCFFNLPAEDIFLIQAFNTAGFRLSETRLTFYHDAVAAFDYPRFPVRAAVTADIPLLKEVAVNARNDYDRYHADVSFTREQADAYLATYAEACVNGLAETVLVPAEKDLEPAAFLAISGLAKDAEKLGTSFAQITLTAVSPVCKGWHLKLSAETIQYAKSQHREYVLMTTQATNRAVFRTTEKLGFKLGNTTHILATNF